MIYRLLFSVLVINRVGKNIKFDNDFRFGKDASSFFHITPKEGVDRLKIMICNPANSYYKWEECEVAFDDTIQFYFIDFFDWNPYSHPSYPFFKVKIVKCDSKPEFIGYMALIETIHANVTMV